MSDTVTLENVLKSVPIASSLSRMSMLCVDSSNTLSKANPVSVVNTAMNLSGFQVTDFNQVRTPGLYITAGEKNPENSPKGIGSYCSVLEVFQRFTFIVQRLTTPYGNLAIRGSSDIGETWTDWCIL